MIKFFIDRGGTFTDIVAVTDDQVIIDKIAQHPQRFLTVPLVEQQWVIV